MAIQQGIPCCLCTSRVRPYTAFHWGLLASHMRNTHKIKMKEMKGTFLAKELASYTNSIRSRTRKTKMNEVSGPAHTWVGCSISGGRLVASVCTTQYPYELSLCVLPAVTQQTSVEVGQPSTPAAAAESHSGPSEDALQQVVSWRPAWLLCDPTGQPVEPMQAILMQPPRVAVKRATAAVKPSVKQQLSEACGMQPQQQPHQQPQQQQQDPQLEHQEGESHDVLVHLSAPPQQR